MAHYYLGHIHLSAGKYEQALKEFQTTLRLYARFVNAHISVGRTLELQKKYPEAIRAYRRALDIDPGNKAVQERVEQLILRDKEKGSSVPKGEFGEMAGTGG